MSRVRCRKCGSSFDADRLMYCGEDFCLDCREGPQDDVVAARNEAYNTYVSDGHNSDEADRRARDFAREVERERAKRGK